MKYYRSATVIVLFVLLSCLSAKARQEEKLEAFYFFSTACPECTKSAFFVKKLSRDIITHGYLFGQGNAEPMPFRVRKDDETARRRYDVQTFPTLVIVKNGEVKQVLSGEQDIKHARMILSAFRRGAWNVSELIEKAPQKTYTVIGWIMSRGEYVKNAGFSLTDRKRTISIKPWLPLEAIKSPFKKARPRLMSDVMNRPVCLEGVVTKINDDFQFTVRKEIILE